MKAQRTNMLMRFNFSDEMIILNLEFAQASDTLARNRPVPGGRAVGCMEHESSKDQHVDASNRLARNRPVPGGRAVGCMEQHESSKDQHVDASNRLARNRPVPGAGQLVQFTRRPLWPLGNAVAAGKM